MPNVFKTTVPYMIELELYSACCGPLQLGVVLVVQGITVSDFLCCMNIIKRVQFSNFL